MIELLSPAGDMERFTYALRYGADAVYIGGRNFGLRANATNFSIEEIKECAKMAHEMGKRVYVTVNIVFHNEDLEGIKEYLFDLEDAKVDAIIVSDPMVLDIVKKNNINLELHISTQASVLNSRACKYYINKGAKRIVLAREASKENIERIKDETGIDLECFIQGAMCTSFSGRCVLSNYATNRDSNRGGCAQVCRWSFDTDDETFEMMSKDLNMITEIATLKDIGVNSLKIEGRMRSIYYIATVLHTYKSILNKISTHTLSSEYITYATNVINRVANRESLPQFFRELPGEREQYFNEGKNEVSNQDFLGVVLDYSNNYITLEVRNNFKKGDIVQIFGPNTDDREFVIEEIKDEDGLLIEVANHPASIVKVKCPFEPEKYSMMHVKTFDIL